MKRYTILLSLALVALLAVGASAQTIETTVTGTVGAYAQYDKYDGLSTKGMLYARLAISDVRGVNVEVDFGNVAEIGRSKVVDQRSWFPFTEDGFARSDGMELSVSNARVIIDGAYWSGGPEVKTTIGRQRFGWNNVVAAESNAKHNFRDQNAIRIEGLDLGGITLDFAHVVQRNKDLDGDDVADGDKVNVLRARTDFDVVSLTGIVVGRGEVAGGPDRAMDLAVLATVEPADGISVDGIVARDGQNEALHYRLNATLNTIENFTLKGSFWSTDENFAPSYAHHESPDLGKTDKRGFNPNEATAFSIGAETTQGGIDLSATFTSVGAHDDANYRRSLIELGAETSVQDFDISASYELNRDPKKDPEDTSKIKLGVGTDLASVRLDYEGVIETDNEMVNSIAAKTTIDTVIAEGINLSGKVTLDPNDAYFETRIEADAEWRAPNGFGLGLHYANYDRSHRLNKDNDDTLRHNGVPVIDIGNEHEEDGFYVTASYVVEF